LASLACASGDVPLVAGAGPNAAGIAADFRGFARQVVVSRAGRTAAGPLVTLSCVHAGGRRQPRSGGGGQDTR
jgi:hypothetical protein